MKQALSVPQFLDQYSIGRTRFYEELNAGRLKARKLGTKTVIAVADAEAWLKSLPAIKPQTQQAA